MGQLVNRFWVPVGWEEVPAESDPPPPPSRQSRDAAPNRFVAHTREALIPIFPAVRSVQALTADFVAESRNSGTLGLGALRQCRRGV